MIAAGSNEVRQVFVGDGQVHGKITYEYLIEPELNRQLENIAIPYKNNPAYIDRITVTRRTIQNGSIIAIDYKDVSDVDPNQNANDSEYCVWFANDRVDEKINNYTTKIAILNRKGFREFKDKIVQVPMKNPFDDSNTPYVNCSIRQLYQRCAYLVEKCLIMVKPDGTVVKREVGNTANNSNTVDENVIDLYICGETCLVATLWKKMNPETDGNYLTGIGVQRFKLNSDSIDWTGYNYVINNVANNDYVDNIENKIVYDPFHDWAYVRYQRTNTAWKLDVGSLDTSAYKLPQTIHNMVYLTSLSSVACLENYENKSTYLHFYNNINKNDKFTKIIYKTCYNNFRLDPNCLPIDNYAYVNYKDYEITYGIPDNKSYLGDRNFIFNDYTWLSNHALDKENNDYTIPYVGKIVSEKDFRLQNSYRISYRVSNMSTYEFHQYRTQFDKFYPFYCLSYDDTRTNINLIKKTNYSNEEIIATYGYPHQTNFSKYKPGIVLAKG